MSSTKRSNNETQGQHKVQAKRRSTRPKKTFRGWTTKCAAFVAFLATSLAVVAAVLGMLEKWDPPNTTIFTDEQMRVAKLDGDKFEFQVAVTLMNEGGKPDTVRRPHVAIESDQPIINYQKDDVVFFDEKGKELNFPKILQKDSPLQFLCAIRWKPSGDYDIRTSEQLEGEAKSAVTGKIELTGLGTKEISVERRFGLLAADSIRGLKPGQSLPCNYLYLDGDHPRKGDGGTRGTAPLAAVPVSQTGRYEAVATLTGGVASSAFARMSTAAGEARSHYAVKGEVASGKEVPSQNSNDLTVNIRPCGGGDDLVIFRSPFRKRVMGSLPCGVTMVQVEKL
jgi:hypothetical protein